MKTVTFKPGDRVQLTGKFLQSTGQQASSEGRKIWIVKAVKSYEHGSTFVTVDETLSPESLKHFSTEEMEADPSLKFRRINAVNLKHYGKPSSRDA